MSHAFDNKGSNFDANRDLHEWWSAPVREQFTQKSKCIRHLYDQFEIAVLCTCSMRVESKNSCFRQLLQSEHMMFIATKLLV